jgi:hypothetical protein
MRAGIRTIRAMRLRSFMLAASLVASGCGGDGGGRTGPSPAATLQVSGTYATAVTLQEDACGGVTVQPQPTTVTQSAGRVALQHAGTTYSGPIGGDGAFSTDEVRLSGADGPLAIRIAGRFTATGFDALVTVDVQRASGACRYVVRWAGTKQGPPNVIPG